MTVTISVGSVILFQGDLDKKQLSDTMNYLARFKGNDEFYREAMDKVCNYYPGITEEQILSNRQFTELVKARALIYWRLINHHRCPRPWVERVFNKDHATIINGLKRARLNYKPAYFNVYGEELK